MKLTGVTDLTLDLLRGGAISMTLHFKTPTQAKEAFEEIRRQSDSGVLELKLTLGDRIAEH